ncbi:putative AbiEii toxin of type IV toxin-antitoxin system [Humibacillus xanthopallidus]|uniref:Putative AbiEii toxin of type IV toxin-antitoxin system n=1 Tax=Humibacillus xanthopallidus TaxID=412689 RepID=A0A543PND7_9MICO|nr:putative AbiEii toxin of type IV toxin-antitoxin system [Humibacillus xanthopallidus]
MTFGEGAYLVGPNNAGKSTLLTAIRTADVLLRQAYRRSPAVRCQHHDRTVVAHPLSLNDFPALRDSLRHEFGNSEASLRLTWVSGAILTCVWPAEVVEEDPFFYLERMPGMQVRSAADARAAFPPLGVIPILSPVEHSEALLTEKYVSSSVATRLSSRHFRNHLRLLQSSGELHNFLKWASPWLTDITFDRLGQHLSDEGQILEAYFFEAGSRVPKELVWAGDGVQIWLQLLFHIYRVGACATIVLDEPEVYLHPDLQRRLVQLLESTGKQLVVATHSSEMVAEADSRLVTLVDKSRRRARRARTEGDLEVLSGALGTAFNLRLAKALRSRVAFFVEGKDMSILRRISNLIGCKRLAREDGVTVVPLQGYSRWTQVEPFAWLCRELLPEALKISVVLDRDYRSDSTVDKVERQFQAAGMQAHVWRRKELESYLISAPVISRVSGASVDDIVVMLNEVTASMENDVFGRMLDERLREQVSASRHAVSVTTDFKQSFDGLWAEEDFRLRMCPPKQIISALNSRLQPNGLKTLSSSSLARALRVGDVDPEMSLMLRAVESAVD